MRFPLFSLFSFGLLFSGSPVESIPLEKISEKLDSVIVYSPVDPSTGSAPSPISSKLKGEVRSVYFAAFSPSAIQNLIDDQLKPQGNKLVKNLKFAPISLAKFDKIVQPRLTEDSNARVVYIPDPSQSKIAESLYIKQGIKKSSASSIASSLPAIFCPKPALEATPNSGPLKGQTFIPCSTDHATIKNLVDIGISSSTNLAKKDYSIEAIPLPSFVKFLASSPESDISIRILPSPANIKVINKLKSMQ